MSNTQNADLWVYCEELQLKFLIQDKHTNSVKFYMKSTFSFSKNTGSAPKYERVEIWIYLWEQQERRRSTECEWRDMTISRFWEPSRGSHPRKDLT